jgi:DNA mismatch repair protein MutS2
MKTRQDPTKGYPQIDLHGLGVEEAVSRVDRFVQQEFARGRHWVKIIHGNGSGALRSAVRRHLEGSSLVKRTETGMGIEGGVGVLIVTLEDRH